MTDEELIKKYKPIIISVMLGFRITNSSWDDLISECKLKLLLAARKYDEQTLHKKIGWLVLKWITDYLTLDYQVHYGAYSYKRNNEIKNGTKKDAIRNIPCDAFIVANDNDDLSMMDLISLELYHKKLCLNRNHSKFDDILQVIYPRLTRAETDLIDLICSSHASDYDRRAMKKKYRELGITSSRRHRVGTIRPKDMDIIRKLAKEIFPKNKCYKRMKSDKLVEALRYQMKKKMVWLINVYTNYRIESKYNKCDTYNPIYTISEPIN